MFDKNFNNKDLETGNTRSDVVKISDGIYVSVISPHINLNVAGNVSGTEIVEIEGEKIFCPCAIVDKRVVLLITAKEAFMLNNRKSLAQILEKRENN